MIKKILICTLLLVILPVLNAKEIAGVTFPDEIKIAEKTLTLNGVGLRKKLWIKVYAGGLYLTEGSSDADMIINADKPMAIRMHFIYDGVSAEKLVSAWNEGFNNATGNNTAEINKEIALFNAMYTEEAVKDDIHEIVYSPGSGVTVTINGKNKGTIPGLAFKKALFGIWLCDLPADSNLKTGMLGK